MALLAALLTLVTGCSRQAKAPVLTTNIATAVPSTPADPQKLPFDRDANAEGIAPSESLVPASHRVPVGTPITIRLQTGISSASAHAGDPFTAVLDEPIVVSGRTLAPRGTAVIGRVVAAKASGHLQDPGYLRVTLVSITVNGQSVPVQSSSIFVRGKSHETRNWESIGGGAAAGALIGGLAGGGKGAVLGSTVGAAGGTGFAYTTGKKDVGFGAERRLTFRLTDAVEVKG